MAVRSGRAALVALALGLAGVAAAETDGAANTAANTEVAENAIAAAAEAGGEEARGPVTNLPLPRFVSLRADSANVRRGPGTNYRVDWEFRRRGWPLEITAEYGHWRRVRDVEGASGWVHYSLLSGARTAVFIGNALAPIHASRSETSAVLAYAEPGVVAQLEGCDGEWCRVSVRGAEGHVRREGLWGTD